MTADEFLWWWVERQTGFTEEVVRNDPTMQRMVREVADSRNLEVFDRVIAELGKREGHAEERLPEDLSSPDGNPRARRTAERPPVTQAGITVAEAARRLGCSGSKAYRLFGGGDLTGHKVGDKILIDPTSVEAYKRRNTNTTGGRERSAERGPSPRRRFRHLDL